MSELFSVPVKTHNDTHTCTLHTHTLNLLVHPVPGNDVGMCVTDDGSYADSARNCSWTRVSELCTGGKTKHSRYKLNMFPLHISPKIYFDSSAFTVVETLAEGGGEVDTGKLSVLLQHPFPAPLLLTLASDVIIPVRAE